MQKVVGSSPIIRSSSRPRNGAFLLPALTAEEADFAAGLAPGSAVAPKWFAHVYSPTLRFRKRIMRSAPIAQVLAERRAQEVQQTPQPPHQPK